MSDKNQIRLMPDFSVLISFLLIIILEWGNAFCASAQTAKDASPNDSSTINHLVQRAISLESSSPQQSMVLINKADSIAQINEQENLYPDILYQKGKLNYQLGNYKESLIQLLNALSLYEENKNPKGIADSYNQLGSIYIFQGDYTRALDFFLKSLQIKDSIADFTGISNTYNNIGTIFYEQYNYNQALAYFFKSIEIDHKNQNETGMAKTFMNIGTAYMEQLKYDSAVIYFNKSLEVHLKYHNMQEIASCYTNLAIVSEETMQPSKAMENYQKSLKIYEELGAQQGIASTLFNIGFFYSRSGQFTQAINNYKTSIRIAQKIGSVSDIEKASRGLSDAYSMTGNYKEAYSYFKLNKLMNDKLADEKNVRQFTQLEMNYEFDQQKKQIEFIQQQKELAHQAELKRQRMVLMFTISGAFFLLLFALVVLKSYRQKKRDNELLTLQKAEISNQRDKIDHQNHEITDSIHYARRIQTALLPPDETVDELLKNYFVLYKPRDIVSGDFYWVSTKNNKVILVIADCTGHGVPGAFMSMLGISFLNEIVLQHQEVSSDLILNSLRNYVIKSLRQTGKMGEPKDGMDISLAIFDFEQHEIQFSGAYNPLYLIRKGKLTQINADKMPIGISDKYKTPFNKELIKFESGDAFYMFSDGYIDQFGGPENQKFKSRTFKELLLTIQDKNMVEQKEILDKTIEDWRGDYEQIDDILVFGIRV